MQFREAGGKIQCLAARYSTAEKRTKQFMVYSLSKYGANKPPLPSDLKDDIGDGEDRVKWAAEIAEYLTAKAAEDKSRAVERLPISVRYLADEIVHAHDSQSNKLTDSARDAILAQVDRILAVLRPTKSRGTAKARPGASKPGGTGFDVALVDRAKALRKEGLSVVKTADRMTAEGTPVSKSWVQKVTSATS